MAALAIGVLGVAAPASAQPALVPPGGELWASIFDGHGGMDTARAVAVSPDGQMVFVTGATGVSTSNEDYATIAYNAATGTRVWEKEYAGTGGISGARAVAVSRDGSTVYVTGNSAGATSADDFATVAYRASTGSQLWVRRWAGPGASNDDPAAIAVPAGGGTVLVTGTSAHSGNVFAVTIAYNATTGASKWTRQLAGSGAAAMALSPGGRTVYVTGTNGTFFTTIAYGVPAGTRKWVSRYRARTTLGGDSRIQAWSIAAAPGGSTVYVAGTAGNAVRRNKGPGHDYATIAYRASTGAQLWVRRYNGTANRNDEAHSLAVAPGGNAVFVTGASLGTNGHFDYATVGYSSSGARLWVARFNDPGSDNAAAWVTRVSPDATTVYVTGSYETDLGSNLTTIAYNAATGAVKWNSTHDSGFQHSTLAMALAPDASAVYICGGTTEFASSDFVTVAYQT